MVGRVFGSFTGLRGGFSRAVPLLAGPWTSSMFGLTPCLRLMSLWRGPSPKGLRNQQIDRLLEMLNVTHVRDTQIMEVSFIAPEPELARDLANALVNEFIAYNVEADSGVARNTTSFIREQIEKLQRDINEKETLLQEYGKQQDVVLDQSDDILAQQLSELHHELTQAQSELANAEARYMSLEQSDPSSLPEVYNNRTVQELQQEHARLEKEYAELGEKFEPRWPEMQRKRRALEEVEKRLELETRSLGGKAPASFPNQLRGSSKPGQFAEQDAGKSEARNP